MPNDFWNFGHMVTFRQTWSHYMGTKFRYLEDNKYLTRKQCDPDGVISSPKRHQDSFYSA